MADPLGYPYPWSMAGPTEPASNSSWSDWLKVGISSLTSIYAARQEAKNPKSAIPATSPSPYLSFFSGQPSQTPTIAQAQGSSGAMTPILIALGVGLVIMLVFMLRR
jgi:hypothetical protein